MIIPDYARFTSFADVVLSNISSLLALAPRSPSLNLIRDATSSTCDGLYDCPRSVIGILWSCMAVLFTCTWVAVHPNIPRPNEIQWWKSTQRSIGFMLLTLVAPEATLWIAVRQWLAARELVKRFGGDRWTMTHAHFALMGGFTLRSAPGNEIVNAVQVLSLPKGTDINRHYNLPDDFDIASFIGHIKEEEIQDRSHSDGLSKVIAIGQTGWFVLQLVARWAQSLPFTELEVMTVAFATMNIVTYIFWFKKPLKVQFPILVQASWSQSNGRTEERGDKSPSQSVSVNSSSDSLHTHSPNENPELGSTGGISLLGPTEAIHNVSNKLFDYSSMGHEKPGKPSPSYLGASEIVPLMELNQASEIATSESFNLAHDGSNASRKGASSDFLDRFYRGWSGVFEVDFRTTHILLQIVFLPFFIIFLPIQVIFSYFLGLSRAEDNSSEEILYQNEEDIQEKIARLLKGNDLKFKIYRISLFVPCAVAALFGFIHWIGWISTFPTRTEEIIWRISSIVVTFIPIHVELTYKDYAQRHHILLTAPNVLRYIFAVIWFIAPLAYILARFVLIVQSFLTLRDLPCGALQNVSWTDYLPHI